MLIICVTLHERWKEQDKLSDIEQQPTFRRPQVKQKKKPTLNEGGESQNHWEHHIILKKYEAMLATAVSENNSSSGMLIILTKPKVCIYRNWLTYIVSKRTLWLTSFQNVYVLKYSAAVVFRKSKMHYIANIYFFWYEEWS